VNSSHAHGAGVHPDPTRRSAHPSNTAGDENPPVFTGLANIPAAFRRPALSQRASVAKQHAAGAKAMRELLRQFVQHCPQCKLFGRRGRAARPANGAAAASGAAAGSGA
jgi:hypothetical protein